MHLPQNADTYGVRYRSMLRLLRRAMLGTLALAAALIVRVLRPVVLVRISGLPSSRIGPFAGRAELYLCQRDAGVHDGRRVDVFFNSSPISNHQLKKMLDRTLRVWQFSKFVNRVSSALPGAAAHMVPPIPVRDTEGYLSTYPTHLGFTSTEESLGQAELLRIGVPSGSPFVCFLARDSTYLTEVHGDRGWSYHNYRDCNIENYLTAATELARRGNFALRMGAVVDKPIAAGAAGVIDYASEFRTDFMDIYLSAKCRFFLSSGAGLDNVAQIFRRPTAYADLIPLEFLATWGPDDLIIPRKLWKRDEERLLTFREILDSGVGRYAEQEQYDRHGLEPVHNTPEEIQALAIEMDERLNGTWTSSEEDEELQQRFWSLFQPSDLNGVFLSRIGAEFLRQNRELLD